MSSKAVWAVAAAASAVLWAGCTDETVAPIGSNSEAIIGGIDDTGDPAVVETFFASGFSCSGTVIAPRVILTAAHCVETDILDGTNDEGVVEFGHADDDFFASIDIIDMAMHRYFDIDNIYFYDIGLILMKDDAPVEPMAFNLDHLPDSELLGKTVRVVGFGVTDGEAQTGGGTKRKVNLTVDGVSAAHLTLGDDSKNICQGDSGGPTILDIDGVDTVVAVSSYGSNFCRNPSKVVRTDAYEDEFLIPVFDAWTGLCKYDARCVTEGCRTVDPDCDACGYDGFCATGCDTLDLDCPVVGLAGERCENGDDCESRVCIDSPEDARLKYCSAVCDPAVPIADTCPTPLTVCESDADRGHVCRFSGITPGAQGAVCASNDECRSHVCYPSQGICIEACDSDCPEGFSCEDIGADANACVLPTGGGDCGVVVVGTRGRGAGLAGSAAAALIALFALAGRRRRGRR